MFFIVLVKIIFNLIKITQLQFDWNKLECTLKKHDFRKLLKTKLSVFAN